MFRAGLLRGQVALVTGGGTGLGQGDRARAGALRGERDDRGRRAEVLEQAAGEIAGAASPARVDWSRATSASRATAERLCGGCSSGAGRLDLLVNNAGGQFFSPAELIAAKGWRAVWRLNVEGMLNMSESGLRARVRARRGGDDRQRNALPPPRDAGNGPFGGRAGDGGGADQGAGRALGRTTDVAVIAVAAGTFDTEVMAKYPASVRAGMSRIGARPAARERRGARLARRAARLASRAGVQRLDGDARRCPGQLVRAVAAPGAADESGEVPVEERR